MGILLSQIFTVVQNVIEPQQRNRFPMAHFNGTTLKKQQVANHLRQRIVEGELAPGARLPTRAQLEEQFQVSTITVQQALDSLVAAEFVRVNGRRGTFVAPNPPHLTRYALVLPLHPTRAHREWTRFASALCDEASRLQRENDTQITAYTGVEAHEDSAEFQSLLSQVRGNRLAGLIFTNIGDYENTPLICAPGVGRVWVEAGAYEVPGVAAVSLDKWSFWLRALDYFASRGRKRLAILQTQENECKGIDQEAVARGLVLHPHWTQTVNVMSAGAARNCAHLLFHQGHNERPDALLISDDNLLESATQGLWDAGAHASQAVEVVTHCNFPNAAPSVVPVKRLGYDIRAVLKLCIEIIDCQQRGEPTEPVTHVPAQFEDEL